MRLPPSWLLPLILLPAQAQAGESIDRWFRDGKARLDLRYRYESVDQEDKPLSAAANTLRLRLNLASGSRHGVSGLLEFDHIESLGAERFDDTRNGRADYPLVADPEGSDFNQAWLQYAGGRETILRLGRQRINLDNERYIGASGWRQNEQTHDALRLETKVLPGATLNYAFIDRVQRIFGPESGTPPATLEGDSHLLNLKLTSLPLGALSAYSYHLDFDEAPQLSSDTLGLGFDGKWKLGSDWTLAWTIEYARQREAGDNATDIDAHHSLIEVRVQNPKVAFIAGHEILSGERGDAPPAANAAFQTPLATLHRWQGWADKFLTTPPAGIEDSYLGFDSRLAAWKVQGVWHHFSADATGIEYGTEIDLQVSRQFAGRYELLVKYADYAADERFTDTRKFWIQLGATF